MKKIEHELQSLEQGMAVKEAGVTEMLDLYEAIERIYLQSAVVESSEDVVYASDSTNALRGNANLG